MNSTFVVCFYVVKSCPVLVAPTNGIKDSNDTYCGSTVEFNCDACYELMGNSQLTCLPNQTWSGEEPNQIFSGEEPNQTWSGEEPNCNCQCKLGFVLK